MKEAESNIVVTDALLKRFYAKTKLDESTGCLLWIGAKKESGYGIMMVNREMFRAHRLAYIIHHGSIPEGLCVMHSCNTPACVSEKHLSVGTHLENMQQMYREGRRMPATGEKSGRTKWPDSYPKGEKSLLSKLTESQVIEIREKYALGGISHKKLGREYGVTGNAIMYIVRGISWTHIPMPENISISRKHANQPPIAPFLHEASKAERIVKHLLPPTPTTPPASPVQDAAWDSQ